MPETRTLYERLKAASVPPPHNLPPQPTMFVGREAELAEMARYLAEYMLRHKTQLNGDDPRAALVTLNAERENVRAAWNWAVERRKAYELDASMECL